jgi:FAD/FMN-containing dehydrogenase
VAKQADNLAEIAGWGHSPVVRSRELRAEDLAKTLASAPGGVRLSRGLGRSYGDSSLPVAGDTVVATPLADRLLGFDEATGLLSVESGVSLDELVRLFLPRGWFVPVSPGTKYVTVGGMVASDVHGKNHHRDGCFGEHVTHLLLRVADGRIVACSPTVERDLFRATVGGMGLTGHILEITFRMQRVPSPWIWSEAERAPDIEAFTAGLARSAAAWPFTMGWIDCLKQGKHLGRGIIFRGRWAEAHEAPASPPRAPKPLAVPVNLPSWTLNGLTVSIFNALYYRLMRKPRVPGPVSPYAFFYPLDALRSWNRIYGKAGCTQYQCVIPGDSAATVRRFMEVVAKRGGASPLCVIKDCGAEGTGLLSFPKPGISIAVDLPVRSWTQGVVDELNEIVIAQGGRIYLTKDAFTRREHYARMEPRLPEWQRIRRLWDPERRLRSLQSTRLLDEPEEPASR